MRSRAVIDTNVVVAGLLTAQENSPTRILDGLLGATFPFAMSEALLAEYRSVLVRPALRRLHGLNITEVETILTDLVQHAIILKPAKAPIAPDPGDQFLWNLPAANDEVVLVTGDKRLLRDVGMAGQ